jgi:hypothetical protein
MRRQDDGDIIGTEEAAEELGVTPNALRAGAKKWGAPHKRVGTEWHFSRRRLRKWIQTGEDAA